jgi:hypothetical protein
VDEALHGPAQRALEKRPELGRHLPRDPFELTLRNRLRVAPHRSDRCGRLVAGEPATVARQFEVDDVLDRSDHGGEGRGIGRASRPQVGQVEQPDVVESPHRRIDIPWQGEVDQREQAGPAPAGGVQQRPSATKTTAKPATKSPPARRA